MRITHFKNVLKDSVFWALALITAAIVIAVFKLYAQYPQDGYRKAGQWNTRLTITGYLTPEATELEIGDRIISINGVPLAERRARNTLDMFREIDSAPQSAIYEVERAGQILLIEAPLRPLGWIRLMVCAGVQFFVSIVFILTSVMIFLRSKSVGGGSKARSNDNRSVRVVCYALLSGAATLGIALNLSLRSGGEGVGSLAFITPVTVGLTFALLLHFFLIFPPRDNIFTRKPWLLTILHLCYISLPVMATASLVLRNHPQPALREVRITLIGGFIVCSLLLAFRSYRRVASPVQKNQMRWLAWGASVGIGPWFLFSLLPMLAGVDSPLDHRLLLLTHLAIPISVLVAISRYRLLGIDGLMRRSLVYTVTMASLTAVYLAAFFAVILVYEASMMQPNPLAAALATTALLIFAFNPLRRASERLVTRLFYRGMVETRHAFTSLSVAISQAIHLPNLVELLITSVPRALACSGAALVVIQGKDYHIFASGDSLYISVTEKASQLVSYLESNPGLWATTWYSEIEDREVETARLPAGASLCLPLAAGGKLVGIYLLGEKLSRHLLTGQELENLRTLAHHAASALDNALAYQRLRDLNAELESMTELRTRQLQQANQELGRKNTDLIKQNSELARVVNDLKETQAALVEAERRAAIGEIIITVCHEINNPLTAIMGQAQLIELRPDGVPPAILEKVRVIDESAERIRRITEKMRSLRDSQTITYVGNEKMIDINRDAMDSKSETTAVEAGASLPKGG
jgi:GAF domain-containing protein